MSSHTRRVTAVLSLGIAVALVWPATAPALAESVPAPVVETVDLTVVDDDGLDTAAVTDPTTAGDAVEDRSHEDLGVDGDEAAATGASGSAPDSTEETPSPTATSDARVSVDDAVSDWGSAPPTKDPTENSADANALASAGSAEPGASATSAPAGTAEAIDPVDPSGEPTQGPDAADEEESPEPDETSVPEDAAESLDEATADDPDADDQTDGDSVAEDPSAEATEAPADADDGTGAIGDRAGGPEPTTDTGDAPSDAPEAEEIIVGLTAPVDTTEHDVYVVGASWAPDADELAHVDIRELRGETWGEWQELAVEPAAEDSPDDRPGTEPYIVVDSDDVQVRLVTSGGAAPTDARLDVIGVDMSNAEKAEASGPAFGDALAVRTVSNTWALPTASGTPAKPTIKPRSAWGAKAPRWSADSAKVTGAVLHHTAGSNGYSAAKVPGILRGIQSYHFSRGWRDVGYNFLVDRFGTIWEGREGGVAKGVEGAHATGANSLTTGVSVMGDFSSTAVPQAAVDSVVKLLAWKLSIHGVKASGAMTIYGKTIPAIVGHRDVPGSSTACPGARLYALLPAIRSSVTKLQNAAVPKPDPSSPTPIPQKLNHDLTGSGKASLLTMSSSTSASIVQVKKSGISNRAAVSSRDWSKYTNVTAGPSLSSKSQIDIIARTAKGGLSIFEGKGKAQFSWSAVRGAGWQSMRHIMLAGDFNGDGRNDLMAIGPDGGLYLYPGNGRGWVGSPKRVGEGWQSVTAISAVGDFTGDGKPDIVAAFSNGDVRVYASNGRGGWKSVHSLGRSYGAVNAITAAGDANGDGKPDLLVRNTAGTVRVLLGNGAGGKSSQYTMTTWKSYRTLLSLPRAFYSGGMAGVAGIDGAGTMWGYRTGPQVKATSSTRVSLGSVNPAKTFVAGDLNGSGTADVVSIDSAGNLKYHAISKGGKAASAVKIGTGWGGFTSVAAAGDYTYDKSPDLVAITSAGQALVYPIVKGARPAFKASVNAGTGFKGADVFGVGPWYRGGKTNDLVSITSAGDARLYRSTADKAPTSVGKIGSGWGAMISVAAVGDVSGDGLVDVVACSSTTQCWVYPSTGSGGFGTRLPLTGIGAVKAIR